MILVPVREHDADQLFLDGRQGRKMRNHHIHAKMAIIGKHQAAIYHHHAAGGFPQLAVEANLAQPSQWRYRQIGFVHQSSASRTNSATGQTRRACPFVSSGTYCRPCRQKFSGDSPAPAGPLSNGGTRMRLCPAHTRSERFSFEKIKREAATQRRPTRRERKNSAFSAQRQAAWFETQRVSA